MTTYTDLDLIFDIHPVKKDLSLLTDTQAIIAAFKHLVLTNHYEIPFHPEIGSNIRSLLFENITPLTISYIKREITNVAKNFDPRITINNINISADTDKNFYSISIEFSTNIKSAPINIEFKLNRLR